MRAVARLAEKAAEWPSAIGGCGSFRRPLRYPLMRGAGCRLNTVRQRKDPVHVECQRTRVGLVVGLAMIPLSLLLGGNREREEGPAAQQSAPTPAPRKAAACGTCGGRLGAQPAQIAIALVCSKKSPVMLPIPETSKVKQLGGKHLPAGWIC